MRTNLKSAPALALFACMLAWGDARAAAGTIGGDHRLVRRFVEDGAIVQKGWLEAAVGYDDGSRGRDLRSALTLAFRLGPDVEAGVVLGGLDRRRDPGDRLYGPPLAAAVDASGVGDAMLFGKVRVVRRPFDLALGASVEVPLADDEEGLGPGVAQYRAFVGLRTGSARATVIGWIGAGRRGDSEFAGRAAGLNTLLAGAGVLVPVSRLWTFVAEADYEGARFSGEQADGRALAGLDWRPTDNLVVRGEAGAGLTGGAPDRMGSISFVFHF